MALLNGSSLGNSTSAIIADSGEEGFGFEGSRMPADQQGVNVEVLDAACVLIRGALSLDEQEKLCSYIEERDRTPADQPRAMVPTPKTLILGEDGDPKVKYVRGDDPTVVSLMVEKVSGILKEQVVEPDACPLVLNGDFDIGDYTSLSMATIRYEAPDGRFPPHIDHCKDSFVFLASLGRTANFMVKGPSMETQRDFKFYSGDVLVFDASTEAGLLHSCMHIDESASQIGELLANRCPNLQKHRYGVQCRMYFK